ncbi:adenylate kinase [Nematocida homosporus]|uniref:adenylate kinase n=1 Tax=Nematocida homosporus TaxID=1912981 RepID=UPI00221FC37B|nr:adenylate kinase [Nematocida homosporus]KAI5185987.1 adenylate kinase [Nematocida homosporus]
MVVGVYKLLFLGPPLAGKGTQCKMLSEKLRIPHISSGDILRQEMQKETDLAQYVRERLAAGKFVSNEVIRVLVNSAIKGISGGFILDGYPRTLDQLESIDFEYDRIIVIDTPIDCILDRVEGRLCHPGSGRIYHTRYNPPRMPGLDDITGEPLVRREDDRVELIRHRVLDYIEKTGEVIKRGIELKKVTLINGNGPKELIHQQILAELEKIKPKC